MIELIILFIIIFIFVGASSGKDASGFDILATSLIYFVAAIIASIAFLFIIISSMFSGCQ
jgi:hypothetical protein